MAIQKVNQSHITSDGTSEAARDQYATYGTTLVPQLLSPSEVAELREVFTTHADNATESSLRDVPKVLANDFDPLKKYPRFMHPHRHPSLPPGRLARQLFMDQRLLQVVENLIGPAYGAQSMFYFKPAGARGQALHQDNWFLQAHPETCLAAWVAVDDSDEENGGLSIIPGSHRNDVLCHGDSDLTVSFSPVMVKIPDGVDVDAEGMKLQTRMRAGDVLFFHGSLIHGSVPNTSADRFRRVSRQCPSDNNLDCLPPQSLIYHYIPQASMEVAKAYQPLVSLTSDENRIPESQKGGPCGEKWYNNEAGAPMTEVF